MQRIFQEVVDHGKSGYQAHQLLPNEGYLNSRNRPIGSSIVYGILATLIAITLGIS